MQLRQLKVIRKQNKMSQQQVSDVLGVSRSTYCSYETGRRTPDINILMKLSEFYRLPVDRFLCAVEKEYLFDEEYYEGQTDTRYLSQLSKEEHDLIVKFRCLDKEEKKNIKNFVNERIP